MNVSCPECRSVFRLDPAKITSVSMRARCSVCGGLIPVGAAVNWGDDLQGSAAPVPAAALRGTPAGVKPILSRRTPASSTATTTWPPPVPRPDPAPPPAPRPAAAVPAPPPNQPSPPRQRTPPFSPKFTPAVPREAGAPGHSGSIPKAAPSGAAGPKPETGSTPIFNAPFGAPLTPPSRGAIPEPAPPKPATPSPAFTASGNVSAAFSTPSTPTPPPAVVQRKPINPFLANDPNQKARRLARALVSDMVAYHPAKREEGLQGGTLKQLFREEIKKSYEEYVEQVGREFAESTMHFQEALNDVLAGGRKVF
jgi:predicted Zn finger-like uncharacterized protein